MSRQDSTSPVLSLSPGTRLSDTYEIEHSIGLGGMAEVYRARNVHTGEPVAIKVVVPEFARDETVLALFKKEGTVLSRLRHDAIVHYHVFTIEREMERPYLVMDFVDGVSLSDKLEQGPIAPQAVRQMLLRIAAGLELAHKFDVIHRDLSPDNIILQDGDVRLATIIDFGIAKAATIGEGTVLGGNFAGKYNYVSPEQLGLHGGEITGQSDVYSLGLVGAAALIGHPVEMGGSHAQVIEKRRVVPDLGDVDPGLKAALEAMLQPAPADRPDGMGGVISLLQRPPALESKTVIHRQDDTHLWAGPAATERLPDSARAVVPPLPAKREPPALFDPTKPSVPSGESPFGGYEPPPDDPARGRAVVTPLPPRKSSRVSGVLVALALVLTAGGVAGWGYTQGWFDGAPVPHPPIPPGPLPPDEQRPQQPAPQVPQQPASPVPQQPHAPAIDPVDVPPLELTTQRMAWVTGYPMQQCQYMSTVAPKGEDTISIEAFATTPSVFEPLDAEFMAINGKAPEIVLQPITQEQCTVADFLRAIDPITIPGPSLALSSPMARDGVPLAIELTNSNGWETRLFLVDDEGAIYDITRTLPEGDGQFSLELNLSGAVEAVPGILLTIGFPSGRAVTPLTGNVASVYLPALALEVARIPEQVSINAQYLQLSP